MEFNNTILIVSAIAIFLGFVSVFAVFIGGFAIFGQISRDDAEIVLTAFLVAVTALYTVATYGQWLSEE